MEKTLEEIMEILMRLDRHGTCIRMRDLSFPASKRWYVSVGMVTTSSLSGGGYCPPWGEGTTPYEAAQNMWTEITGHHDPDSFFIRFNCKLDVPIPGDDPQVWVRWSSEKDDWEDVLPTQEALAKHCIPRDRIRTYQEQKAIDRY